MIMLLFEIRKHPYGEGVLVFEVFGQHLPNVNIPYCKVYNLTVPFYGQVDMKVIVVEEKDLLFFKLAVGDYIQPYRRNSYIFVKDGISYLTSGGFMYTVRDQ